MKVVLEFNVTNIIKTGKQEADKNRMETAETIKNEASIPAIVKQETKNKVEEEIVEKENQEVNYSAEYFKTQKEINTKQPQIQKNNTATQDSKEIKANVVIKEELPVPDNVKQERVVKTKKRVPAKAVEVTEKVKQAVTETTCKPKSVVNAGQSGGISKSDRMQHELNQSSENRYIKEHFDYINKIIRINISYPYKARKMSMEGDVILSFIVCLDGNVKGIKVNKSSGFSILDDNAEQAVRKASPFPPPPVEVRIVIPITYKLNT
ncbi:periplasmic protein [Candidatus Scalindua japonica]|uniref:Periplasmic protein n=1 Tax=Candidatus Scalindua japonica TaxID=1284222 RepID=A0A286U3A0_9BACT|nr:energy transducer TonB [Candidatus Scalindua japonica]GAX62613.1 periplasmic protein [Candidatus Scalindua japonica]